MIVEVRDKKMKCHCPSTGRIGNIIFEGIPCLISKAENPDRKTKYTVEAISMNLSTTKDKKWIGINQTKMNKYIEYFFKNNQFSKMVENGENVERERKLGKSRIDFQIGKNFIEAKMPLINTPTRFDNLQQNKPASKFDSFDRLIKHLKELSAEVQKRKSRAIILICYQYDAKPFERPRKSLTNKKILKAADESSKKGVENWQANFRINKKGIELTDYFKLKLF